MKTFPLPRFNSCSLWSGTLFCGSSATRGRSRKAFDLRPATSYRSSCLERKQSAGSRRRCPAWLKNRNRGIPQHEEGDRFSSCHAGGRSGMVQFGWNGGGPMTAPSRVPGVGIPGNPVGGTPFPMWARYGQDVSQRSKRSVVVRLGAEQDRATVPGCLWLPLIALSLFKQATMPASGRYISPLDLPAYPGANPSSHTTRTCKNISHGSGNRSLGPKFVTGRSPDSP